MSFASLGLAPALISAVTKSGYTDPTPVQAAAIPAALKGMDLMVSSQTGSGKTAAFMLPSMNRLAAEGESPLQGAARRGAVKVLVLTPTRELAQQVSAAARTYGAGMRRLHIATVVGGMPYGAQLKSLSRPVDVLVATPGRLLDHVQSRRVDLSQLQVLVLDEADRMLDMGFIDDIEAIVGQTPAERQTLLFSATLDGNVARLASRMMRDPQRIELSSPRENHKNITQSLMYADDTAHKARLLDHVLRDVDLEQAIIFTSTKRAADDLAGRLNEQGFAAAALHGDMTQRARNRTIMQVQRGQVRMLVATDVAARGIDVQGISHVVNFDLPMQAEDYVHRIGRTGRAGRSGLAFTLATHAERHKIRRIEKYTGQPIPPQVVEGLEPRSTPRPEGARRPGGANWRGKPGARPGGQGGYKSHGAPRQGDGGFGGRPAGGRSEGGFGRREGGYAGGERRADGESRGFERSEGNWQRRPEGKPSLAPRSGERATEWKPRGEFSRPRRFEDGGRSESSPRGKGASAPARSRDPRFA
ncbi:DEAD/DEAH box helicase [Verticiella sediminum]|uniref:DEAD/DEAH box helicase n=1 Tax=Verticiella sediminum TaxID=1247510 RepID=A0A556ADU7_9BURK|nr:DEAD/DEAH box helicase [Verticiella sediminum]TSH91060.1 DEAD/DEAH box helicase [Verticiella sediminum]